MKLPLFKLGIIALLFVSVCACDDDDNATTPCGDSVVISNSNYEADPTSVFVITNAVIDGDCLSLSISSSGCEGNTWETDFFTSTVQTEQNEELFYGRLDLTNLEACLAIVETTVNFDLTPLQISGSNNVSLEIDGWDETLMYTY